MDKIQKAIKRLENMQVWVGDENKKALTMAISSLKTDEAYQLEYENRDCVEVVRCKDCKYYHVAWDDCNPTNDYSEYWCEYVSPNENDYCSLGERKEQEQTDDKNCTE